MKAYEIFQAMSGEHAASIFQYLRDEQREVYAASLGTLAGNRKLRPVFIQRKPVPAQIEWLVKNVKLRGSETIAEQIMQLWLMKAQKPLLVDFLDGMGISHDGEGAADDIPDSLDKKKLGKTVTKLLADHDPAVVRIYLQTFQLQNPEGWPELTELIEATPALRFPEATPEPDPAPEAVAPAPAPAPAPAAPEPAVPAAEPDSEEAEAAPAPAAEAAPEAEPAKPKAKKRVATESDPAKVTADEED